MPLPWLRTCLPVWNLMLSNWTMYRLVAIAAARLHFDSGGSEVVSQRWQRSHWLHCSDRHCGWMMNSYSPSLLVVCLLESLRIPRCVLASGASIAERCVIPMHAMRNMFALPVEADKMNHLIRWWCYGHVCLAFPAAKASLAIYLCQFSPTLLTSTRTRGGLAVE